MTTQCESAGLQDTRRLFWATQPDACGVTQECGNICGTPGLELQHNSTQQATISNQDWLRGLMLNMLLTDGRLPETECGYRPGARGGHWSSSYAENEEIGTLMRTVLPAPGRSIQQDVSLIASFAQATLQRLVQRGIAVRVEVEGTYVGNGNMTLNAVIYGQSEQRTQVGITGSRRNNAWIWNQ